MDTLGGLLLLCAIAFGYFLPTIVASARDHRSAGAILILNLLFGWTFIGWGLALVWAFTYQEQRDDLRIERR